jgi:hypothetical protein
MDERVDDGAASMSFPSCDLHCLTPFPFGRLHNVGLSWSHVWKPAGHLTGRAAQPGQTFGSFQMCRGCERADDAPSTSRGQRPEKKLQRAHERGARSEELGRVANRQHMIVRPSGNQSVLLCR